MLQPELLLTTYEIGDKFGHIAAYVILGMMLLTWLWIMFKYLDSRDLND